jgi:hypothetical protein
MKRNARKLSFAAVTTLAPQDAATKLKIEAANSAPSLFPIF